MPSRKPAAEDAPEPAESIAREAGPEAAKPAGHRSLLRTELLPAACTGVLMGFVAAQEGSGAAVAVIVALVGCGVVLGLLALKRGLYGP